MNSSGGGGTQSQQPTAIKAVRIQTAVYGVVRSIAYGTARVTGNIVWYGDFVATKHVDSTGGGGGK